MSIKLLILSGIILSIVFSGCLSTSQDDKTPTPLVSSRIVSEKIQVLEDGNIQDIYIFGVFYEGHKYTCFSVNGGSIAGSGAPPSISCTPVI